MVLMPSNFPRQDEPVKGNETSDEYSRSFSTSYGNEPTYGIQNDANNQSDSIVDTETLPNVTIVEYSGAALGN